MNAIEHGNHNQADLPVQDEVIRRPAEQAVRITDAGQGTGVPATLPDLDAKLTGLQSPRGWGLFLIEKMVDRLSVTDADARHTVELAMRLEEAGNG